MTLTIDKLSLAYEFKIQIDSVKAIFSDSILLHDDIKQYNETNLHYISGFNSFTFADIHVAVYALHDAPFVTRGYF